MSQETATFIDLPTPNELVDLDDFKFEPIDLSGLRRLDPNNLEDTAYLAEIKKKYPDPKKPMPADQLNAVIKEIVDLLPSKNLWPLTEDGGETDYPEINREMLKEAGSDHSSLTNREIWVIGNLVFFRRLPEQFLIHVGYFETGDAQYISWDPAFSSDEDIVGLRDFIRSRAGNLSSITMDDVKKFLDEYALENMP